MVISQQKKAWRIYLSILLGWMIPAVWVVPAVSAERIAFSYGVFGEFYISIADLEIFSQTGEITPSFAYYAERVSPENLAKLRDLLNRSFDVDLVTVSVFLNLPIGKELTRQMSLMIDSPSKVSQPALRASLILAAAEPEGLTIINVLRFYSTRTLGLNTRKIVEAVDRATTVLADTERVFQSLESKTIIGKAARNLADIGKPGTEKWREEYLSLESERTAYSDSSAASEDNRTIRGVVYLPVNPSKPAPLIVVAPGLNTNWQNFSYIAKHLASYGFGVAAVNFPGTNAKRVNAVLKGLDTPPGDNEWIEQPKIVTQLLDEIDRKSQANPAWRGKLDLQRVGVVGQSLGGYTAMALAGAKLDWQHLKRECQSWRNTERIDINPSLYWQCQNISAIPPTTDLQDRRIIAAIAINPVTNPIFSQSGLEALKSPLMIIAGDRDFFAPALDEQLKPFTWLPKNDKYLVLIENTTHFSFIGNGELEAIKLPQQTVDADLALARSYLKTLGVAFFQTYLTQQSQFSSYLTKSYLKSISQQPLPINILRSLNGDFLQDLIDD